jgi:hypothetical protein
MMIICGSVRRTRGLARVGTLALWVAAGGAMAATDRFVASAGGDDAVGGYTNWAGAATSLQAAIDACAADDTVWVENGFVTDSGGRANYPAGTILTNRIVIDRTITVRSVSGDTNNPPVIIGSHDASNPYGLGDAAARCVYLAANAKLIGFLLTNGATQTNAAWSLRYDMYGGGAYGATAASSLLSNCVITANVAKEYGGGAYNCALFDCLVTGNQTKHDIGSTSGTRGGGVYGCTLYRCLLAANHCPGRGGAAANSSLYACLVTNNTGARAVGVNGNSSHWVRDTLIVDNRGTGSFGGFEGVTLSNCQVIANTSTYAQGAGGGSTLYDCDIIGNSAAAASKGTVSGCTLFNCRIMDNVCGNSGGGVSECTLFNCLLSGNAGSADGYGSGGGAFGSTLYNCLIVSNETPYHKSLPSGGGAAHSLLINCTLAGNQASGNGGGAYASVLTNCISWNNNKPDLNCTNAYSCGESYFNDGGLWVGNTDADPRLFQSDANPYALRGNSPCKNTGFTFDWMTDPSDIRARDGEGKQRVRDAAVDMGAFEYLSQRSCLMVR